MKHFPVNIPRKDILTIACLSLSLQAQPVHAGWANFFSNLFGGGNHSNSSNNHGGHNGNSQSGHSSNSSSYNGNSSSNSNHHSNSSSNNHGNNGHHSGQGNNGNHSGQGNNGNHSGNSNSNSQANNSSSNSSSSNSSSSNNSSSNTANNSNSSSSNGSTNNNSSSNTASNSNSNGSNSGKVTICHFPGGDRTKGQTLSVSQSALTAHQANHGDVVGVCPTSTASTTATAGLTYRETNFTSCASGSTKGRAVKISKNGRITVDDASCN